MVASIIPQFVPAFYSSMYSTALYGGLIVAFIGLMGIAMEKRDIQVLILTDIVGLAMLIVVAAVGTDLSEALILPGLVVELAEIMAISEILISREMRKKDVDTSFAPMPLNIDMEIMTTAPNFIALLLIGYGVFLSGFTGGAVAGGGIVIYVLSRKVRGLPIVVRWSGSNIRYLLVLMDYWIPILLYLASILVTQFIPGCFRIALESGFQDWIDWNNDERGIRKKMIIPNEFKI